MKHSHAIYLTFEEDACLWACMSSSERVSIKNTSECFDSSLLCSVFCLFEQVRLLSEQLRDAQNMISIKDRSGGWRNPDADADVQVSSRDVTC